MHGMRLGNIAKGPLAILSVALRIPVDREWLTFAYRACHTVTDGASADFLRLR